MLSTCCAATSAMRGVLSALIAPGLCQEKPSVPSAFLDSRRLRPQADRAQVAAAVGRRAHMGGLQRARRAAQVLRAGDAALPLGRAAHRTSEGLFGGRRDRPLPAPQRLPRGAPARLRRVRPARREPRHPHGPAPARVHRDLDRRVSAPVRELGHLDRLDARVRHARAALLPLDAVDLPAPVRAGPGLPQRGRGQLVPQGPDGAGQRAGDRRPLRALRQRRRVALAGAVVLQDHRLRRPPARGPGQHRLARARQDDAAELDRALGGRAGQLPLRGAGHRLRSVHHPPRHPVRRHLLRDGARAPRRAAHVRRARGARVRGARAHGLRRGARRGGSGEDRRGAGPPR